MSRERPILFKGRLVRAILEGRKTQTRRIILRQPPVGYEHPVEKFQEGWQWGDRGFDSEDEDFWPSYDEAVRCPYGEAGDTLWVRETWLDLGHPDNWQEPGQPRGTVINPSGDRNGYAYRATTSEEGLDAAKQMGYRWKPSIHMPKAVCRLRLVVKDVRVERLQTLSEEDARAEGVQRRHFPDDGIMMAHDEWVDADGFLHMTARDAFRHLWDSINAARGHGWGTNPWVWVVESEPERGGQ